MGIENNEAILATTWNDAAIQKVKAWVGSLPTEEQSLFAFIPALVNNKVTIVLAPDGSKKGNQWSEAEQIAKLRERFIQLLHEFDYMDGSSPFDWIEVGYGEFGQKVLRGNCKNRYSDKEYEK